MSFISYRDFFKHSNVGFGDFERTVTAASHGGAESSSKPITLAMDRNLGSKFRWTTESVNITLECTGVFSASDSNYFPTCVAILGHNLGKASIIAVTWSFRTGVDVTQVRGTGDLLGVNMNTEYFILRERLNDNPYKVSILVSQPPIPWPGETAPDFVDIGRVWVGNAWDLDDPNTNDRGIMDGGWSSGFLEGADSKLTRGNQSYSNRLTPLKTLDFSLDVKDDLANLLGQDSVSSGVNSLDQYNSLFGYIHHLQGGGASIVIPKESGGDLDQLYFPRFGIYGETAKSSNAVKHITAEKYRADFKIRELQ